MATEKVGVYRRWCGPVPTENGKPIPRAEWPKKRKFKWLVRWYGAEGKRYGETFKTRKEADRRASRLQLEVESGKKDRPASLTLREFIREHKRITQGQVAHATLQLQMQVLGLFEKFIGGLVLLSRIQPRNAEAFVSHYLALGRSTGTVNKYIRTLQSVFNRAIDARGYLPEGQNPFAKIKERRKADQPVNYVGVSDYRTLVKTAKRLWWKALTSLAYGSGLRRGEILNLTWADVDFEKQLIRIVPKKGTRQLLEWEPKDHERRTVPASDEAMQFLAEMQIDSEERHPYIFVSQKRLSAILERREHGKWSPTSEVINNLARDFAVIQRKANVDSCSLHDLRRSAITNWASNLPIQVVQQLAGHSDISTTRKYYLAVRSEDMASAGKLVNEILSGTR